MDSRFRNQKVYAVDKFRNAVREKLVDTGITPLLEFINSLEDFYTTSSCAGRISLIRDPGTKTENAWLGKWHSVVKSEDIAQKLKNLPENERIWFKYEPTILHIVSRTVEGAKEILKIARNSGFKRAGIQSLKNGRYVVEICGTDRIDVPVAENGKLLVNEDYIKYLVDLANRKYQRGKKRLKRLESNLRDNLS
ncbi:MAG TPA: hypothetical protein EYP86_02760 [Candidatus Altiarchaeales archaeon]|nr:hypothetical protein [Candidatus Altiarchaeales archaeon]